MKEKMLSVRGSSVEAPVLQIIDYSLYMRKELAI